MLQQLCKVRGVITDSLPRGVRIVTTSWDDGAIQDFRIARLLEHRAIGGTFYVPISGPFSPLALGPSDLRRLAAQGFEIGAHAYSHLDLSRCGAKELIYEVSACKTALQDLLGEEVRMFAYPRGRYGRRAVHAVREAGYVGARTTRMFADSLGFDPYRMPTTLQAFPHSGGDYLRNLARQADLGRVWNYLKLPNKTCGWTDLAMALFDSVLERGGIWHLYGHSWEIQALNLWRDLEEILDYVRGREGVLYVSNGEVVELLQAPKTLTLDSPVSSAR